MPAPLGVTLSGFIRGVIKARRGGKPFCDVRRPGPGSRSAGRRQRCFSHARRAKARRTAALSPPRPRAWWPLSERQVNRTLRSALATIRSASPGLLRLGRAAAKAAASSRRVGGFTGRIRSPCSPRSNTFTWSPRARPTRLHQSCGNTDCRFSDNVMVVAFITAKVSYSGSPVKPNHRSLTSLPVSLGIRTWGFALRIVTSPFHPRGATALFPAPANARSQMHIANLSFRVHHPLWTN